MTLQEAKEVIREGRNSVTWNEESSKKYREALQFALDVLGRVEEEKITTQFLLVCEKQLNETIGFMLTTKEARMFSHAIVTYLLEENSA